jgi:RHS repeat-associated protein
MRGRLASKIRTTDDNAIITTTYEYSSQGRLLKVVTPTNTIEYRHNALGNRVAKLVDGDVVEKYLWENKTRLLAVYDGSGNLKQRYEYAIGNTPASYIEGSNRYYILTDQLGSPRMVTDEDGTLLREIEYDSFGNIVADSAPEIELPFGFAGGLYDTDTGLIRFGYRDYDPETGRWTARDPIGFDGGDTNLYGYVLGDPVNFIDPEGKFAWVVGGALVGGAFGAITSAISAASGPGPINWSNVAAQAAIGGLSGAINGALISTLGPAATFALNAAAGIGSSAANQATSCDKSVGRFVGDAVIGTLSGYVGGGQRVAQRQKQSFLD